MEESVLSFGELMQMFTTTIGSAAVIAAVSALFFSSEKRRQLRRKHKTLHRILIAVLFGLLSIYASISAVEVNGLLCNCRNLPPLYAGMVGGPIAGVGAALIGAVFRLFYGGEAAALPCAMACLFAGILGSVLHEIFSWNICFHLLTGACAVVIVETVHMLFAAFFGIGYAALRLYGSIVVSNALGMMFCLYIYTRFEKGPQPQPAQAAGSPLQQGSDAQ